jgi:hypothetical protein
MVKNSGIDRTLLMVSLLLIAIGFLMIFSTTPIIAREKFGDSLHFFKKQSLWLALGLMVFTALIFSKAPFYLNQRLVMAIMAAAFTGLSLVFFFQKINNTSRWIRFAGFSVQPSEFAKIALVLYLAMMLSRKEIDVNNVRSLGVILLPVVFMEGLILKEPDFGNFVLIGIITLVMLFVAGVRLKYFVVFFALVVPLLLLLIRIDPMRQERDQKFFQSGDLRVGTGISSPAIDLCHRFGGAFRPGHRQFDPEIVLSPVCLFGFYLCHHRRRTGFFRRPGRDRPVRGLLSARHDHRQAIGQSPYLPAGDRARLSDRVAVDDQYFGGRGPFSHQGHSPAFHLLRRNIPAQQLDDHRYHPQYIAATQGGFRQ